MWPLPTHWVGHIAFVDDGSSDGTFELLQEISGREKRVSVRRVIESVYKQEELVSQAANELIGKGFSIVVPFDADEFWSVTARDLENRLAGVSEAIFTGRWVNFVQLRAALYPTPRGLFGVRYRSSLIKGDKDSVSNFEQPFISVVHSKVGCKATRRVEFARGQHNLVGSGAQIAGRWTGKRCPA